MVKVIPKPHKKKQQIYQNPNLSSWQSADAEETYCDVQASIELVDL